MAVSAQVLSMNATQRMIALKNGYQYRNGNYYTPGVPSYGNRNNYRSYTPGIVGPAKQNSKVGTNNSSTTDQSVDIPGMGLVTIDENGDAWQVTDNGRIKISGVRYTGFDDTPISLPAMQDNGVSAKTADNLGKYNTENGNFWIKIQNITADVTDPETGRSHQVIVGEDRSFVETNNDYEALMHQHNLFRTADMDLYNQTYRFGYFNKEALTYAKEFLFFTKPDLHIMGSSNDPYPANDQYNYSAINSDLLGIPFWRQLRNNNMKTIKLLQSSLDTSGTPDKFNHLLQNQCISTLEVPALSSEMVNTATNEYGVDFGYRGSSEGSDDKPSFSLEFKDTKYLDVYYYFKAYEEYETMKHHGTVRPFMRYINNRVLYDQIAIYKFLVDEDMETILYYGKMYGVTPKSLPRDVFGTTQFDNGLSYSIDFEAAFYEDMKPEIIEDFNALSRPFYNEQKYVIDIYNQNLDGIDNRSAKAAIVETYTTRSDHKGNSTFINRSPTATVYKLKWKGGKTV